MEQESALAILKALSDGLDPATGEPFPASSPYQQPDVIRALYWAVHALQAPVHPQRQAAPRPEGAPVNAGRPWSEEEDARLGQAFDAGTPVEQLAQAHQRSRWAIEARLVRLGKIAAPQSGFAPRYPMSRKNTANNGAATGARG
jgi:hypothetical protein